jgi:hypothetical protein
MPYLTADALTTDPDGMAFLRDVLAQPAAAPSFPVSANPPPVPARRRARRVQRELPERSLSLAPTPVTADAAA